MEKHFLSPLWKPGDVTIRQRQDDLFPSCAQTPDFGSAGIEHLQNDNYRNNISRLCSDLHPE